MFFCIHIDSVKKLSLLIALLMQPMMLQAESTDNSTVERNASTSPGNQGLQGNYTNPNWPASRQVEREIVPPPPPGPYMSLALNDFSGNRSSFPQGAAGSVSKSGQFDVPKQALSPDVQWPKNLRTSKHWLPENGYRYVPLQPRPTMKQYQETPYNSLPNYNQGYRRSSNMNAPDPRWTPSTEAGYRVPYSYAPASRTSHGKAVNTVPYPSAGQP